MFLASRQTGNAMATTLMAVLLPAATSTQHLRGKKKHDKLIETKLFRAQQRFRCGFSEFYVSLCLCHLGSGAHTELFRLGNSGVFSAGLNLFSFKVVVGRVWISVGVACFETPALTTLLIKGTSTLWFRAPKAMCMGDNQVTLHCLLHGLVVGVRRNQAVLAT